eukprot:3670583-Prorocentrum_lima.AAC.1
MWGPHEPPRLAACVSDRWGSIASPTTSATATAYSLLIVVGSCSGRSAFGAGVFRSFGIHTARPSLLPRVRCSNSGSCAPAA